MKRSFQFENTSKGIKTRDGKSPVLLLRIKRNGNLEIFEFNVQKKIAEGLISFKEKITKDGKSSFWYTISADIRFLIEFKNRRGKIYGFYQFVNSEKHIELTPVYKKNYLKS